MKTLFALLIITFCISDAFRTNTNHRLAFPLTRLAKSNQLQMGLLDGLKKVTSGNDPIKALAIENESDLKRYSTMIASINALEDSYEKLSNEQLREKTNEFKSRLQSGQSLDSLIIEAFAVAREASWRVLQLRPFDVQLMGGLALHEGRLAEMATGEGKTLACVMPTYLNALTGKSTFVITTNDYLARRDGETMGQVFRFLGQTVGVIQTYQRAPERKAAYNCDITYISNQELGFDYLRDNLAMNPSDVVQTREFNFCVVDEADSILVDEARTPLIISRKGNPPTQKILTCASIAGSLKPIHYDVSEKDQKVDLTKQGYTFAEQIIGKNLFDLADPWAFYLLNAIKAQELYKRDREYIIVDGKVQIIDSFSGRVLEGRRFSDGLQQALEAKENLPVSAESQIVAKITYQNLFRLFPRLAGMTGTAYTEAPEFQSTYNLKVLPIPLALPLARRDNDDAVFRTQAGKMKALLKNVLTTHEKGRPVLIGTTSIATSEEMVQALADLGIKAALLNARPENIENESEIVSQAGRLGAVTVATNMAGRGTDIVLGGSAKGIAKVIAKTMMLTKLGLLQPPSASLISTKSDELSAATKVALQSIGEGSALTESDLVETDEDVCALPPIAAVAEAGGLVLPAQPTVAAELALKRALISCLDLIEDPTPTSTSTSTSTPTGTSTSREKFRLQVEDIISRASDTAPAQSEPIRLLRTALTLLTTEFNLVIQLESIQVKRLGGLYVVGTSKHESRRIDNQLRGRAGRQGDPGGTRFFLSLEDDLFRSFGADKIAPMLEQFRVAEDMPIESDLVVQALDKVQTQVEAYFQANRQQIFKLDDVMGGQRNSLYSRRKAYLTASDAEIEAILTSFAIDTMHEIALAAVTPVKNEKYLSVEAVPPNAGVDLGKLVAKVKQFFPNIVLAESDLATQPFPSILSTLTTRLHAAIKDKTVLLSSSQWSLPAMTKNLCLIQLDESWCKHLQRLDLLREEMVLQSFTAEKDVMVTYREKANALFSSLFNDVRRNTVYSLFIYTPK